MLIVAQIASTAATARLVVPREFGLYATALAASGFAGYFTMVAIGGGLQRRSRLGEKTVGTAMTLSLASSLLISIAVLVGASLWARAWGVPDAASVVRIVAITLFLTSAATVPIALIRRRLEFGKAAVIETSSVVLGLAVGVALAIELHSAVALALGQAVGAATLFVAATAIVRDELRLSFERADARELFTFAGQVGVLDFSAFIAITMPSWFTARAFGPFVLGLYSRASTIVALPLTYAATSIYKVLYPLYGRVRDDLTRTKVLVDEGLTLTTGLGWPLFALVAGASPVIVEVLLGPGWEGAKPLVALFALMACGDLPSELLKNAAQALGWMRLIAVRQAAFFVGVAATLATVHLADLGLNWLLAGLAASQWATYLLTLSPFVRRGLLNARSVMRGQGIHAGAAVAIYGVAAACAHAADGAAIAVQILSLVAVAVAVCAALIVFRSWLPAGRVLGRRLAQVAPRGRG
ncbi:MAG: oligosaccharide flippase family protein [Candidatus Limnocylindria bacterium]